MRFLIIPEDHRNDQYMLEPILSELVRSAGFANPKVRVCRDALMGGVSEALKPERLEEVFARYAGMIDVFLLCVDRDADRNRQTRLDALEAAFGERLAADRNLVSEPGGGRRTLGRLAARRIARIRQLCPEDFDRLGRRIEALRMRA